MRIAAPVEFRGHGITYTRVGLRSNSIFVINSFPPASAPRLKLVSAAILQLPQLATIDALTADGWPFTRDRRPI